MSDQLKDKANEISLMLVLLSEGDESGQQMIVELCRELSDLAVKQGGHPRLSAAVDFVLQSVGTPRITAILQEFTSSVGRYLDGDTDTRFPNETSEAEPAAKNVDVSSDVDQRFLAEYIETHSLLLEDFEGSLLDARGEPHDPTELTTVVKRYIHNLKGDSGSIGLIGIERVCHAVEDALTGSSATLMMRELLLFKEWVVGCLNAYARGVPQEQTSDQFLQELKKMAGTPALGEDLSTPLGSKEEPLLEANDLGTYTLSGEHDIFIEFAAEAEEHLNSVESVILDAQGSYSKDEVDKIFRGVHSIKGGSAYFTIDEMTESSHILENFLSEVRDGKRELSPALSSLLLIYIDLQKSILRRAKEATQKDGIMIRSPLCSDFLKSLEEYRQGKTSPISKPPPSNQSVQASPPVSRAKDSETSVEAENKSEKLEVKTFVKVETARLDHLIDSIGEMVIYSSMLIRHCRELLGHDENVMDATHRVEKFSRDLQDIGMSMRLVPIKGLFQKMSRLVWDTSKKLGKEITFSMEGEDTELDRNLIDKLADPLMHMVRNSIDHGIETPDEREKKGKPRVGKVRLAAYHSGGNIHIEIQDDGKGLDTEKLLSKAIEKGVVTEGQKLSDDEIRQLIFAPGFSTAAVVTDISGRGVGMDVVRRNVESLRGRIHIKSKVNEGSVFTIELPLTLAIIDGIQIEVGQESFLIPSLSIIEFVRPKPNMITNALDYGETLHFRGQYLPIYRIADLYGITPRYENPSDATLVVVDNNQEQIALMVDEILGECSTVIKSLGSIFEEGKGLAGCAIMPRGNVALILDIRSLVALARAEYSVPKHTIGGKELVLTH
jgi:two-component system, chemotaxis family, sensor kinase CheA